MLLLIFLCYPAIVSCHCFLLSIEGSDGVRSTAFGARLLARGTLVQNTGIFSEDLEEDLVQKLGKRPGPCGRIYGGDSLPGFVVDVEQEIKIAEASGIPSASSNGTIQMGVYVDNPDGAGPFTCEYSIDTSLQNFQPMKIVHQVEGFKGVNKFANNFVYPLTAAFNQSAKCSGGGGKNVCIVRCINPNKFGSCFAVKLSSDLGIRNSNSTTDQGHQSDDNTPLTSGASRGIQFGLGWSKFLL